MNYISTFSSNKKISKRFLRIFEMKMGFTTPEKIIENSTVNNVILPPHKTIT